MTYPTIYHAMRHYYLPHEVAALLRGKAEVREEEGRPVVVDSEGRVRLKAVSVLVEIQSRWGGATGLATPHWAFPMEDVEALLRALRRPAKGRKRG
ncbi:hypothetical protein phiKo_25 [Thermus phage phiKo]|nr:hypothetical protein phiKo_25 [Thermus phage phiKo]